MDLATLTLSESELKSCLGLWQKGKRDEHPAWCYPSSISKFATEKAAQTKCLKVSHLKLWKIILFIKNISILKFIYIYTFLCFFYLQISIIKKPGTFPRLKKQRSNPSSVTKWRGSSAPSFGHIDGKIRAQTTEGRKGLDYTRCGALTGLMCTVAT